jgi:hypothetical protein
MAFARSELPLAEDDKNDGIGSDSGAGAFDRPAHLACDTFAATGAAEEEEDTVTITLGSLPDLALCCLLAADAAALPAAAADAANAAATCCALKLDSSWLPSGCLAS